jgi:hypothetical protein
MRVRGRHGSICWSATRIHTGSRMMLETLCWRSIVVTTLTVSAEASMPLLISILDFLFRAILVDLTYFHSITSDIAQAQVDLLGHKGRRCNVDVLDAHGVLSCQGGRGGHAIAAMRGEDFLVCFQASVIAGQSGRRCLVRLVKSLTLHPSCPNLR